MPGLTHTKVSDPQKPTFSKRGLAASRFNWNGTRIITGLHAFAEWCKHLADTQTDAQTTTAIMIGGSSARRSGSLDRLLDALGSHPVKLFEGIPSNPTVQSVQEAATFLAEHKPTTLVALGGGSVLDTAKVASVAAGSECTVESLLSHDLQTAVRRSVRELIAVPTTAGTGAEVTPFATVWNYEQKRKYSLDHELAAPTCAIVDGALTASMPPPLTKMTVGDALSHALESLWSRRRSAVSQACSLQAVRMIVQSLPHVLNDGDDLPHRHVLAEASLLAGMAISLTRTAAAHAMSYPLTLRHEVPHGVAVASLCLPLMEHNAPYLPDDLRTALAECFSTSDAEPERLVRAANHFFGSYMLSIPLRDFGINESNLQTLVDESNAPGRLDNNVAPLDRNAIDRILRAAL